MWQCTKSMVSIKRNAFIMKLLTNITFTHCCKRSVSWNISTVTTHCCRTILQGAKKKFTLNMLAFWLTPETWHLLAFTSASISGVKSCVAATFRMSFKYVWALSAALFYWCSSQRTLVHKDMSSLAEACTKHLWQGMSLWGSLEKDTDRMCPTSPRQTSS